ncbi:exo-alpha-sialidase [Legionella lytica]|uniref:Exo-alpha-sialidase n=1 Tax=Legionella lytica TaxID=96232 RepID=A0ABY4Y7Z5_9GAMM|nr:sialidase family protein [Legionella lytica]USQ13736.1 exo-alpha-sialidase [Legionella lytica]
MGKKQDLVLAFAAFFIANQAIAGATFNIVPKPGTSLPTTVVQGSSVSAYYLITNNTSATRAGYVIKGLPASVVTQNTSSGHCPAVISLASKASCVLQLDITGAVSSNFALCRGVACTSSSVPLNVSVTPAPPPPPPPPFFVAAGYYNGSLGTTAPLIAYSTVTGANWAYPLASLASFPVGTYLYGASCTGRFCVVGGEVAGPFVAISSSSGQNWTEVSFSALPPDYSSNGYFNAVACADSFCIAGGSYSTGSMSVPFVGTSTGLGANWSSTYTSSTIPPDLTFGYFNNVSCGSTACIAVGSYFDSSVSYPLIATGTNQGALWTNSLTALSPLPSDYVGSGTLSDSAASGTNFVAAGSYFSTLGNTEPLVISSSNNGATWSASITSTTPVPPAGFTYGQMYAVSCSGSVCVAVGYFSSINSYPLAATSSNAGHTWSYTITDTTPQFPSDFFAGNDNYFSAVSCSGTICIAAGSYMRDSAHSFPLLAASSDGGKTWAYRINSTYPVLVGDTMDNGYFNTASCKGTYCMAAGSYVSSSGTSYPLLAVSSDGGITWAYKVDGVSPALPADYVDGGLFYEKGSAAGSSAFLPNSLKLLLNK